MNPRPRPARVVCGPSRRQLLQALGAAAARPVVHAGAGLGLSLGAAAAAQALTAQATQSAQAPATASPRLARGFNLAHWFEYERNQPLSAAELQGLQRLGLDHVRLPLDPLACGWNPAAATDLPFLPALVQALDWASAAGLTLVLDLHLTPAHKLAVQADRQLEQAVADLWGRLAGQLAHRPVWSLAYELFNEPQYYGAQAWRWVAFQRQLLAAVRRQDPAHLVLLSGNRGGSLDGLLGLWPEPDAHAAYTFHYYEPFVFTHQGLPWLDERYSAAGSRRQVLYPAQLSRSRPPVQLKSSPLAAGEWADYLAQDWGRARIRRDMDRAGAWARARGVRVLCNEFGCIRAGVDPASRYRWMADVRQALEANGLGWTVWEYTHIFGLTAQATQTGQAGRRVLDPAAAAALGLRDGAAPAPAPAPAPSASAALGLS